MRMEQREWSEPTLLIIGPDADHSEYIGWTFVREGYRVIVTESNDEIGAAIMAYVPTVILLDYSLDNRRNEVTPQELIKYCGGDAIGDAPPVLVIASEERLHTLSEIPGVYHIRLPTSIEILYTVVTEYVCV